MNALTPTPAPPFANDVEFLESYGAAVLARAARISNGRRHADAIQDARRDTLGPRPSTASKELERRTAMLTDDEERAFRELEQRVEATRQGGKVLGIDELCLECGLNEIERTTLLLTTMTVLGQRYEDAIQEIIPHRFGGQVTPDLLFGYLELDLAGVVAARTMLQPTARLLRNGLVSLSLGSSASPYDFRSACLLVTELGFSRIVGGDVAKAAGEGGRR